MGPSERSCNVTTNSNDNTLLTESRYVSLPSGSEEGKAFQNGTTPVLTMFFNRPNQAQDLPFLLEPEIHLSCLKTIPTEEQQKVVNNGVGHTTLSFASLVSIAAAVMVVLVQ